MASSTSIKTQQLEHWLVSDLIEYARNPRKNDHAVDKVAAAIREFGFRVPILAKSDKTVVDGHLRLKAAKKLGIETVPVMLCDDMTDAQIKAFRISVNRVAEFADWDEELLRVEFDELADLGFDLELTGFTLDEIGELEIEEIAPEYEEDADGEVIEPPPKPKTKEGDVWILGKHRLMCGDSTSIDAVEKLMQGEKADLWITDPPYNVDMTSKNEMLANAGKARQDKETYGIENDAMSDSDFRQFLTDCYSAADANMRDGASFYIWYADRETYNFQGAARDVEWKVRQTLIWVKNSLVIGQQDYHWKHEPCLYGWKEGAAHNWYSDRKQTTVLEFNRPTASKLHPTMKPIELFEYQIENSTKQGQKVLDSFGGSGTTLIGCEKTNRKAYLMELDPKYCDVIINRWQTLTGKDAVLESTGEKFND